MAHRSLEDKILKYDLSKEKDSDELRPHDEDSGADSDFDEDAFIEEFSNAAAMETQGGDELSTRFAGTSKRGGPKGVLDDYKAAQADQARRREKQALERMEYLRVEGAGVAMEGQSVAFSSDAGRAARDLALKSLDDDKSEAESEDEFAQDDDDFMRSYRDKRRQELQRLSQLPRFGTVKELSQFELLSETDDEDKRVWVIVHLYEQFVPGCRAVNAVLPTLAVLCPHMKLLRLKASEASDTLDHIALPTLMIFRGGALIHSVIRLCDRVGPTPSADDIEAFLHTIGDDFVSLSEQKPRLLLMGPRRSGKSSIQKVVFQKTSPHDLMFLDESLSLEIKFIANNEFVQFQTWDFPGDYDFDSTTTFGDTDLTEEDIFRCQGVIVYVIDAQDEESYGDAIEQLHETMKRVMRINPSLHFEIFIHKLDGDRFAATDHKLECQREVQQRIAEELHGLSSQLSYHMTSIYDHSIYEALSRVIQKIIPQMPLENLLNTFIQKSCVEKVYLFDVVSKIYIATDSNPVDERSYELCSEMIDVVFDITCIYGQKESAEAYSTDSASASAFHLTGGPHNGMVLYLKEVASYLALVCVIRAENFDRKGLLDCNIQIFKNALTEVFNMSKKSAFAAAAKVHKPSPSLDSRTLGSSQRGGGPGGKGSKAGGDVGAFASSYSSSYNGEFGTS